MKNLEHKSSDVLSITPRHETLSANTVIEYSDPIPVDLLIDVFSRVSAKSIARFRCVSKLWESILRRSDFTELCLTNSLSRPRLLLFSFKFKGEVFLFSSPQPQNPHDNLSLVATRYPKWCFPKYFQSDNCPPLYGWVLLEGVVCNPLTRECITLPKVEEELDETSFLDYDPINKQFKVLCMAWPYDKESDTYQILTRETGKPNWRKIERNHEWPFGDYGGVVCINGFLYSPNRIEGCHVIDCFDTRLEEFNIVKMDDEMLLMNRFWRLFNFKGKLVVHKLNYNEDQVMLWVREDATKNKWSKCIRIQLPLWDKGFFSKNMIVGMTDTWEIVFSPRHLSNPFYFFYYNVERNTYARVNIQGFEEFKQEDEITIHTYLDYVENIVSVKCVKG